MAITTLPGTLKRSLVGNRRSHDVDLWILGYTADGEPVTPGMFGMTSIDTMKIEPLTPAVADSGDYAYYDHINKKVVVIDVSTGAELVAAANPGTFRATVVGR